MRILYCLALMMCVAKADAPFDLESKHPLVYGIGKIFSYFHNDNFIDLESQKNPQDSQNTQDSKDLQSQQTLENLQVDSKHHPQDSKDSIQRLGDKPKVLLIMDDLSSLSQVKKLEKLQFNITPSIFPKTKHNPSTPHIAEYLNAKNKPFMVHLPLEAKRFMQNEITPIKAGVSKETLKAQLVAIKVDFPNLVYINNHTGSKFTQSYADMLNLLEIFDELGFKFIDSITTSHPVSERIATEQGRLIMARDVFLDNETNITYIKTQIKSLIAKARKKGYAIGICHPNDATFKALSQMSKQIQNDIVLVSPADLESYLAESKTTRYVRAPFGQ
ncbi:divergent polysaccharide deacetylase family protein [Helicobacter typhlonius]|uniref:divergent polysaccharide deacetylase family protein n=1 Tax=Helicobacter typhlonius TaxID=76936 RepID=UPI002FE253D2